MVRRIAAFLVSVAFAVVLSSVAHSLFIQAAWSEAAGMAEGAAPGALSVSERLSWIAHDLAGMETNSPPIGPVIAVALLLGFVVAGLISRFVGLRTIGFVSAGAVAFFVMFMAIKATQGTIGLAGARSVFGMSAQLIVGALSGWIFARMSASE